MAQDQSGGFVQLRVVRGSVDSLSLYEITDYELELLEQGSPSSTFFNFAILFISVAISFFVTLLTVDVTSIFLFTIFVVVAGIGFAAASVLFVFWHKSNSRTTDLCKKIRARVPTAPASPPSNAPQPAGGATQSDG